MTNAFCPRHHIFTAIAMRTLLCSGAANAQPLTQTDSGTTSSSKSQATASESSSHAPKLIQPEELARIVQSPNGLKPLVLYVGYRVLYLQAHIPQAEYIGAPSQPEGIQRLRRRIQDLQHTQFVVLYCGCCPGDQCPNVNPAYQEMRAMGFTNVKVLYIPNNFGKDWVDKGYPVASGE